MMRWIDERHLNLLRSMLALLVVMVTGMSALAESFKLSGRTMGTSWSAAIQIDMSGKAEVNTPLLVKQIEGSIQEYLDTYESVTSNYQPDSILSRINRQSHTNPIPIPEMIFHNLKVAERVHRETGGLYDITIEPLLRAYGFGPRSSTALPTPPSDEKIQAILAEVGMQHLEVSAAEEGKRQATLKKRVAGLQLDLSSLAKGAAIDETLERLTEHYPQISSMMLEIGGEIKTYHAAFIVGIEKPERSYSGDENSGSSRAIDFKVKLPAEYAIATSGSYKQFHRDPENPDTYHTHLIHPKTGKPIRSTMRAVSVVHRNAIEADAYATAVMIMSPRQAWAFAQKHELAVRITYEVKSGELLTLTTKKFPSVIAVNNHRGE